MNYQEMTDGDLDKLAATEIMGYLWIHKGWNRDGEWHIDSSWNPTHPDSNQAERYLFPKLIEKELNQILVTLNPWDGFMVQIGPMATGPISEQTCGDIEKANRAKVIACLEAWDKLK